MNEFKSYVLAGVPVLECSAEGAPPRNSHDAVELIGAARERGADLLLIPAARLGEDFFRLKTRIAGEFIQKFVTYAVRLAIGGDISRYLEESSALRDFVYECHRGSQVWFVADVEEPRRRLQQETEERSLRSAH